MIPFRFHRALIVQVCDLINEECANGKDPKVGVVRWGWVNTSTLICMGPMQEVVTLISKRLKMDNPQKQFLAVKLVEQVSLFQDAHGHTSAASVEEVLPSTHTSHNRRF